MKRKIVNQELAKHTLTIVASLLATSLVAIIQMVTMPSLDTPLSISVLLFSIAIPLLSFDAYTTIYDLLNKHTIVSMRRRLTRFIGCLLVVVAIGSIFWHFSWEAGTLYFCTSLLTITLWNNFHKSSKAANANEKP
jgi:hypothetical protein